MSTCIFAGTFDPITKGHIAIIKMALKDHDKALVVVGDNKDKSPFFTTKERVDMVKSAFHKVKNVTVVDYSMVKDNYVDYLKSKDAKFYARGIRNQTDFNYENKAKEINAKLYPFIETVYYTAPKKYQNVSSTLVRKKIEHGKDFKRVVPKNVYPLIKKILEKK